MAWFGSGHIRSWPWRGSEGGSGVMNWCRRALALLDVPKCGRATMPLIESVVSWRSRAASASLAGYSTRSLRGMRRFPGPPRPGRQLPKANPRTMPWVTPLLMLVPAPPDPPSGPHGSLAGHSPDTRRCLTVDNFPGSSYTKAEHPPWAVGLLRGTGRISNVQYGRPSHEMVAAEGSRRYVSFEENAPTTGRVAQASRLVTREGERLGKTPYRRRGAFKATSQGSQIEE